MSMHRTLIANAVAATALFSFTQAEAAGIYTNRASFLADGQVTSVTNIDFDGLAPGTVLTGTTLAGATLNGVSGQDLVVIPAASGVRNTLSASSGANVLSPGGSNPSIEDDDLVLTFATPVQAFGLDVVFDAPDGASFVGVSFFDTSNTLLTSNGFIPAPNGSPGFQFIGLVSDAANIARVVFDEFDPSPADDNVAYDSLVISPAPVPLPATAWLLSSALIGLGALRRRRA
ncbi:MAG: VPLPA-CTERM sorting domain-containing protein [Gammaproteobacteria bacterium]|jgi:hypothetical protein|nr:VPLPA-CTERM sorting domain-containing protein [Gammaproteobacteria bacterium]